MTCRCGHEFWYSSICTLFYFTSYKCGSTNCQCEWMQQNPPLLHTIQTEEQSSEEDEDEDEEEEE